MHTIDEYCDKARNLNGFSSDRQLDRALGFKGQPTSQWRTKRAWPADETMIKLAELADEDPGIALLELNSWRTEGPAKLGYLRILEKYVAMLVLPLFMLTFSFSADTNKTAISQPDNIHKYTLCDKIC